MLNRVKFIDSQELGKMSTQQSVHRKQGKKKKISKLKLNGKSFYLVVFYIVYFEASEIIIINEHA